MCGAGIINNKLVTVCFQCWVRAEQGQCSIHVCELTCKLWTNSIISRLWKLPEQKESDCFFVFTGGGKKVTRVEVTMDGGETWHVCTLDHPEKPNKYGKYWCWCFWSLEVEVLDLIVAKEIAVRAWDETLNTQPEKLIWNVMVRVASATLPDL